MTLTRKVKGIAMGACHELTSSAAASLASLSPLPGSDEAQTMTVTSGRKCTALLKKSDPVGSWLKMCLASSRWRSTKCYLTWKPSATPSGRLLFRLVPSMPRTGESGSGFWLTPRASEAEKKPTKGALTAQVRMWPTPHSSCSTGTGTQGRQGGKNLQTAVAMMPTPTANRRDGLQSHGRNIVSGSLNPMWVEWLMGFPIGWTDLKR